MSNLTVPLTLPLSQKVTDAVNLALYGGAFDPVDLFSAGEKGFLYDFSDFATMFQDSAGTIPVTAVEQTVGKVLDKSGNGVHLIQATGSAEPKLSARKNLIVATATLSTQSVTLRLAGEYTVSQTGTGTITLSGAATGSLVGAGSLTFTATAASLTLTVSGTVSNAQLEVGNIATTYQDVVSASVYTSTGFPHFLDFDGTDTLAQSGTTDLSSINKMTLFAAAQNKTAGAASIVWFGGTVAGGFDLEYFGNGILLYRHGGTGFGGRSCLVPEISPIVISTTIDFTGTTHATENANFRINGAQDDILTDYGTANSGSGNFGTYQVRVGYGGGAFTGRMYSICAVGRVCTSSELAAMEAWLGTKAGVPIAKNSLTITEFQNTGALVDQTDYYETSAWGSYDFTTESTYIEVETWNTIYQHASRTPRYGVWVNGAYSQTISLGNRSNGIKTVLRLPSGSKTVSLVNGEYTRPNTALPVRGTWIKSIKTDSSFTPVTISGTNRLVIYGDSIAAATDGLTVPSQDSWVCQLRRTASVPVEAEAWGYRSLNEDCSDGTKRAAFVAKLVAYNPTTLYLAIGTNDSAFAYSVATFETQYAALLDDLHTALPSVPIYCQTPLLRGTEGTVGTFRTAIATVVSTRTSYATLVDGTAIMTTGDLLDGVHPNATGYGLYKDYVKTLLSI